MTLAEVGFVFSFKSLDKRLGKSVFLAEALLLNALGHVLELNVVALNRRLRGSMVEVELQHVGEV